MAEGREIRTGHGLRTKSASVESFDSLKSLIATIKTLERKVTKCRSEIKGDLKTSGDWFQPVTASCDPKKRPVAREVIEVNALVFDFDGNASIEQIKDILFEKHLNFAIYTSYSHQLAADGKPGSDKFRVILETEKPIPSNCFSEVYVQIADALFPSGSWDKATVDPARLWLAPFSFTDLKCTWIENYDGVPYNISQIMEVPPSATSRRKKKKSVASISKLIAILKENGCVEVACDGIYTYLRRPGKAEGQSMSVYQADDGTSLLHVFSSNFPPFRADVTYNYNQVCSLLGRGDADSNAEIKEDPEKKTPLLKLCLKAISDEVLQIWVCTERIPHATILESEKTKHHSISSCEFEYWLTLLRHQDSNETVRSSELSDCIRTLCALAIDKGPEHYIHNRVAHVGGKIYVNHANQDQKVVEITDQGWSVRDCPPEVRFNSSLQRKEIPLPQHGGSLKLLDELYGLGHSNWVLTCGWLISTFMPGRGGRPILVVEGEQGSGKTTVSRFLKSLVDPTNPMVSAIPKKEEDVAIVAKNLHILAFDNISYISYAQSDILATISTGAGMQVRKLYTDMEVSAFEVQCPIIINGITDIIKRADLMDRSFKLQLKSVPEGQRKSILELSEQEAKFTPLILGALYNKISSSLANLSNSSESQEHRLMDCLKWVRGAESEEERGEFFRALIENAKETNLETVENSPVAAIIFEILESGNFRGSATDLFNKIADNIGIEKGRPMSAGYPPTAPLLGSEISRLEPVFRYFGVDIKRERRRTHRVLIIERVENHGLTNQQICELNCISDLAEREAIREQFLIKNGVSDRGDSI